MDIKTLEYMEGRVNKGRHLVSRIKDLEDKKDRLTHGIDTVKVFGGHGYSDFNESESVLVGRLRKAYQEIIDERISELKDEFAKL